MKPLALIYIILFFLISGFFIGKKVENNHWHTKEFYAVYDRANHLDKCAMDFDLLFNGLKDGHKIVAGNRRVTW